MLRRMRSDERSRSTGSNRRSAPDPARPPRRDTRAPSALGDWIPQVLAEMGLDAANQGAALLRAWQVAAGPELAQHCHPQGIRRGVVHATVPDSAWMQRAQLCKQRILTELRRELGDDVAHDLRFRIATTPRSR